MLLCRVRDHLRSKDGVQPIFMKATLLEGTHPAGKQDDRGMTADELLHATISLRSEDKQLVLILDTADLLLHEEASRDNLLYLLAGLRSQDCAVVIGSRLQEATLLKKSITQSLRLDNYDEEELKEAIQNHCKHLSRHALPEEAEAQVNRLLRIVARGLSLREICVNPLMLRMLFLLYSPEGVPEEIHSFQLYEHYWRRRVVEDVRAGSLRPVNRDNLELPACAVALAMTAEGTPEISERMAEHALERLHVPRECLEALYSRGVLKRVGVGRITFFHQTFFEHAAARAFVRGIVEFGVSLLESRTSANPDDLFVAPIYEHAVLLIERIPAKSHLADESLSRALQDSSVLRRISGIYIYCHRDRVSRELEQKVLGLLRSEQDAVVFHFLRHAINWSEQRTNSLIDHLHAIWIRNQWSEREQVISLLERLAFRISSDVRNFLIECCKGDYVYKLTFV